jgi:hypothetical protein
MAGSAIGMALVEAVVWAAPTKAPANSSIYHNGNALRFYNLHNRKLHRNTAPWWSNSLSGLPILGAKN